MIIKDEDRKALKEYFNKELVNPVKLIMFTQKKSPLIVPGENKCEWCDDTEKIVNELTELSEKITSEIYDFVADSEKARQYRVDKIPAIAVIGQQDYGIRFYGIPAGYEFSSLIESVFNVSQGASHISEATRLRLQAVNKDVHIQVFATPT